MHKGRLAILLSGIEREYQQDISRGIRAEADALGYATYFFCCQGHMDNAVPTSAEAEADIYRLPDLGTFDGTIVLRATISNPLALLTVNEALNKAEGLPIVMIDERVKGRMGIGFEDAHCVQNVTEHFITEHGAKRLCFVSGVRDNPVSYARQMEFVQTLQAYDLPFSEEQLFHGDFLREGGSRAARYFLREGAPKPDAIICANDDMALGLCETLMEMGIRIPQDIGVAGFDYIEEAKTLIPTLTTVRRPVREAGREAVRLLDQKLKGGKPPEWTTMQDELIIGQSCGCRQTDNAQRERTVRLLYRQKNELFNEYARANGLAKRMSGTHSYADFKSRMAEYVSEQRIDQLFVAVMDSAMEPSDSALTDADVASRQYTSVMRLVYGVKDYIQLPECSYETEKLFPPCFAPDSAAIFPLHADGRNFGYVAMPLEQATHFSVYTLLPSLGNTLENMRLHATIREYAVALERMYVHDSLTGLLNRRGYMKYAEDMYKEAQRTGTGLMIVCADMDELKRVNDTYGHGEGDTAIKGLARCIQQAASSRDLCIHLSGDEFMVMGLGYDEEGMQRYIRSIETEIDRYNAVSGKPYKISASFGGYVDIPDAETTMEQMSNLADDRMYSVKKKRHMRNRAENKDS